MIVVLGMDRSGTSLCTNVLETLGVSLGGDLLPGDRHNEGGYFEDREIWRVHERLLARLGRSWDTLSTVRPFSLDWHQSKMIEPFRRELLQIARARGDAAGSAPWGFKDPRTVLLMPLWRDVFEELGLAPSFIVCVRHPSGVAQSLAARDQFPALFSELLWLEKTLAACDAAQGSPNCVIHYEDWFDQPLRCVETLVETAGLGLADDGAALKDAAVSRISRRMRRDREELQRIECRAVAAFYWLLRQSPRAPEAEHLGEFRRSLDLARDFLSAVETIAGSPLPAGCYPPSYGQCTPEEIELIETEERDTIDWSGRHDPMLIRLQRTLGEQVTQIRDYASALARAEAFVAERVSDLEQARAEVGRYEAAMAHAQAIIENLREQERRYDQALAHAQQVVEERNRVIREYEKGVAHAQQLVIERDAVIRRYAAALEHAHKIVDELRRGKE